MNIGELIKNSRVSKDMTQSHLAAALGYKSPQFVSIFERGRAEVPPVIIGKLVQLLGLPEEKIKKFLIDRYSNKLKDEIQSGIEEALKKSGRARV